MIFRKPYAFLIKHFKLIHIILLILMSYLLYRTNIILNFFQQYISSNQLITGKDFTGQLFNIYMFAIPFIIIIAFLILLGVMYYKKKPLIFYVYNVLIMVGILVLYNIAFDAAGTLETQIMASRTLRLIRDSFMIIIILQGLGVILTFIRATGFDIKKFDFGHDLEELDVSETDNEEFEVDVNIETNVLKRDINKNLRFIKYVYLENKFIINTISLIVFAVICFTVYMNLTIYNKSYKQKEMFLGTQFTMSVNNSYITNEDYKKNEITKNYLVVVELKIRANYTNDLSLNTTKFELKVGNHTYHHIDKYRSNLTDLGKVYHDGVIPKDDFQNILLVYEIPVGSINDKMMLSYIDNIETKRNQLNPKYINVKIEPYNLDKTPVEEKQELNKVVVLNENILNKTTLFIKKFELQKKFKIDYKYCNKNNCYNSSEYLTPKLDSNYDKALLKIEGTSSIDKDLSSKTITSLYSLINYFGKIRYEINSKVYYYNNLKKVEPSKIKLNDVYYIEIPAEVITSKNATLIIEVRDKSYEYKIM